MRLALQCEQQVAFWWVQLACETENVELVAFFLDDRGARVRLLVTAQRISKPMTPDVPLANAEQK